MDHAPGSFEVRMTAGLVRALEITVHDWENMAAAIPTGAKAGRRAAEAELWSATGAEAAAIATAARAGVDVTLG
jgi:hypothetical protein